MEIIADNYLHLQLFRFEQVLAYAAEGAGKVLRDILPLGAGSNAVIGIAGCLVIDIATDSAYIFCHR